MDNRQGTYCVYNLTRESFLSFNVVRAAPWTWWNSSVTRFRMSSDEGVWLVPSQFVHTFGSWCSVDVIYLDAECRVIYIVEHLRPFRLGPLRPGTASVLRLPAHTVYASGTRNGDKLLIEVPDKIEDQFLDGSPSLRSAR